MSQQALPPSHIQKATAFFKRPVWTRLMSALYKKYIEQGRIGGRIVLSTSTPEERQEIARFLSKPLSASAGVSVRLTDFQQALKSSFGCELPALLQAIFPEYEHITRPQQKEQKIQSQQVFERKLDELIEILPLDSPGRAWLIYGKHGGATHFRQYKNASSEIQEQILQILKLVTEALNQLPVPPAFQSLSHFALHISGDPHFLDVNTGSGRLFLSALTDLRELATVEATRDVKSENQQEGDMQGIEQDHWRHLLYYEAGLLLDTISSTVAVFQLKEAREKSGQPDGLI
ncbi:MAG TPA: TIGR02679 domain-containing protein, partial [Ktedonobacteraceae bacterium]|nr:TIGR02679 domain-containing protein [Ktedonobacteraceae bacterium]